MTEQHTREKALLLLRTALADPTADFRDSQWESISRLVEQRAQLLVVQRTGWGKSLVYFLATRLLRDQGTGPALLISPLLALMRNQILAAERLGIRAATINSSNRSDWDRVREQLLANTVDLLLISPERLANDEFREQYLMPIAGTIGLFVVDEAHCISDWGHDFRPDYRRIVRVLQALPANIPVLATTATANNRVVADITVQLGDRLEVVRGPLQRRSLRLQTIHLPSQAARMAWLAEYLPKLPQSGIVYTLTVRDCERVAGWLQSQDIDAAAYHSNVDPAQREELEQRLLTNDLKVLVATTALGMGFDKPDLGFVVHFQRPGSVVHYYQQVGRAGRAVNDAYGIMLSGDEDQEIADYFTRTALPPEGHTRDILAALERADDGLTLNQLEARLNLSHSQIEKVLKLLSLESPAPVLKQGSRWYATPISYTPDTQKIERLTLLRQTEQARMHAYLHGRECLMQFLGRELDDPSAQPCGRCAACIGAPLMPVEYGIERANQAAAFLRRTEQAIKPRARWRDDALSVYGWSGGIAAELRAEPGRALSIWGDAGWGTLVKYGKQRDGHFDDALVQGLVEMIHERWNPQPFPGWVTCVPSQTHPDLVPDLARRLATVLDLPFVPCIQKIHPTEPQKLMQNSYQQTHNLAGAFTIEAWERIAEPVFLVDDMIDSGWTLTVITALLRAAGSGPVFPVALALVQHE
ncbi:MAG: RecQ family ATP-dependent DNA helicase [Kouleothrix sp.]|nr:RecQ family ATP-dependent DNA helicase [Kouleothrix sp.]